MTGNVSLYLKKKKVELSMLLSWNKMVMLKFVSYPLKVIYSKKNCVDSFIKHINTFDVIMKFDSRLNRVAFS